MRRRRLISIVLLVSAFLTGAATLAVLAEPSPATNEIVGITNLGLGFIGAGLAIGLAGLGVGIGMGTASAAAIGAMAERPEVFGRTLIYIVFIEAVAIYGMVIALMLLIRAA